MQTIIPPYSKQLLAKDIVALESKYLYVERGNFQVYIAPGQAIPNILKEIGRLREITFREVGEGTGKAIDLDEYDGYYHNLFIWDTKEAQIVGGYRLGLGQQIFEQYGVQGFYINSLFDIEESAYSLLAKSIELGRSYITSPYQKAYLPLFLLWQGILRFLVTQPNYQYLIGPVSISKYYSEVSKSMIVQFVKTYFYDAQLASYFKPKTPYLPQLEPMDLAQIGNQLKDLERFLSTIEPDHIKVPVLLKQYTKLNAKFISFNIDPNFSDALDGLMILTIKNLPAEILKLLTEK